MARPKLKGAGIPGMKSNVVNSPKMRAIRNNNVEKGAFKGRIQGKAAPPPKCFVSILFVYQVILAWQISSDESSIAVCPQY